MFSRALMHGKRRALAPRPEHSFECFTDFCTQCGAHRSSIWLDEWPTDCPAGSNVIGISHILAMRHIGSAPGSSPRQKPGPR
jgi:hypothetical protein